MADQVSTFKAVCRGGLNTGSDVLSLGTEASGAATQLVNYEPNLEGGYRKISGYAHSFGTVTGTGSVLGIAVANGINQGILACRTPSSGNNYLHHWNFYYTFTVAAGFTPSVNTTFGVPKLISVNRTLLTPVIVGEPLVLTAVQPTTLGAVAMFVLVEKLSSDI